MLDLNKLCRQYAELVEDKKKAKAKVEAIQGDINRLMEPILEAFAAQAADPEVKGKGKITVPTKYGARTVSPQILYSTKALVDRFEAAQALLDTGDPSLAALVGTNYNANQLTAFVSEQMRLNEDWEPPAEWEGKIQVTEYSKLSVTKS